MRFAGHPFLWPGLLMPVYYSEADMTRRLTKHIQAVFQHLAKLTEEYFLRSLLCGQLLNL